MVKDARQIENELDNILGRISPNPTNNNMSFVEELADILNDEYTRVGWNNGNTQQPYFHCQIVIGDEHSYGSQNCILALFATQYGWIIYNGSIHGGNKKLFKQLKTAIVSKPEVKQLVREYYMVYGVVKKQDFQNHLDNMEMDIQHRKLYDPSLKGYILNDNAKAELKIIELLDILPKSDFAKLKLRY